MFISIPPPASTLFPVSSKKIKKVLTEPEKWCNISFVAKRIERIKQTIHTIQKLSKLPTNPFQAVRKRIQVLKNGFEKKLKKALDRHKKM